MPTPRSGILKRKVADVPCTSELLFRIIHSTNQLSNYGAVSSWCEELAQWTPNQKELTLEKSVAKENEQLLKNVKPQELNSYKLQGATMGHLEKDGENNFKDLRHWRKKSNLRVCEDATFVRKVSIWMSYKTLLHVDDGFGDRTPACRENTLLREDQNSRICATIPGQTTIGPVLQVHIT